MLSKCRPSAFAQPRSVCNGYPPGASEAMAGGSSAPVVVRGGIDGLPNPMPLGEISFCSDSGWRAKDEERKDELKVIYKAGD